MNWRKSVGSRRSRARSNSSRSLGQSGSSSSRKSVDNKAQIKAQIAGLKAKANTLIMNIEKEIEEYVRQLKLKKSDDLAIQLEGEVYWRVKKHQQWDGRMMNFAMSLDVLNESV